MYVYLAAGQRWQESCVAGEGAGEKVGVAGEGCVVVEVAGES